ncbi:MAG: alanine:cation symporter family protein [Oscillospiraceae bacterium]|nr:alanine:cation symporter family protein [Oscillospiraceae bacterium]
MTLAFVFFVGLWFSCKLKFFQFFGIRVWFGATFGSFWGKKKISSSKELKKIKGISPFQAMSTALGGCVGTGNMIGVATAIILGGPGALFWMWIAAFLGMMTSFAENVLSTKYKQRDKDGNSYGGPMFYMEKGLNCKWIAVIFSIACVGVTLGMGNMIQSNSIANSVLSFSGVSPLITGLITAVLVGIILLGGISRIASVTDKMVPIMIGLYVLGGTFVILYNFDKLGGVFLEIMKSAFDFGPVGASFVGYSAANSLKYGISRGLFSNEAGLGSSPIVHAATDAKNPVIQGMWGIFQVFVDTILICSITGLCILITNSTGTEEEAVIVTNKAFESVFGPLGSVGVYVLLIFFAFSTIIGWSYFGERCVDYLAGEKYVKIYKILVPFATMAGAMMNLTFLWEICDNLNVFMMIPNLIAILLLSKEVINISKKFLILKGERKL